MAWVPQPMTRQRQPPGTYMNDLQNTAEAEAERERTDDREQSRLHLVRAAVDEHTPDQRRRSRREVVMANDVGCERTWLPLNPLLHHDHGRHHAEEEIERQQRRLHRAVNGAIAAPSLDRDARPR